MRALLARIERLETQAANGSPAEPGPRPAQGAAGPAPGDDAPAHEEPSGASRSAAAPPSTSESEPQLARAPEAELSAAPGAQAAQAPDTELTRAPEAGVAAALATAEPVAELVADDLEASPGRGRPWSSWCGARTLSSAR